MRAMRAEYREEPCRTALNHVTGMGFRWSLNPYMGCVHQCAFCYVRGFERRADRPWDDRYGTSIRSRCRPACNCEGTRSSLASDEVQRQAWAFGEGDAPRMAQLDGQPPADLE
jgi:hypothetical protein